MSEYTFTSSEENPDALIKEFFKVNDNYTEEDKQRILKS